MHPALRASNMTVDETAPLAWLVRPGLPGVGVHIDDDSPHVCVLTLVKHCFTATRIARIQILVSLGAIAAYLPVTALNFPHYCPQMPFDRHDPCQIMEVT